VVLRTPAGDQAHVDHGAIDRGGADPASIIDWCRERMANYKTPRRVLVVDSLPQNASGKVLKHELRSLAARAR
jgi:acyl-CoA synthetase (AMP-forming)/AMP-acid ligase II